MPDENSTIHRTTDEARGGETTNVMRWVLGISLAAAILALSAIWIFGAAPQDETSEAAPQQEARDSEATDSIVAPATAASPAGE